MKRCGTPSVATIGRTLAAELGEIIDRLGQDHPELNREILRYIERLDQQHPEWGPVMEQAHRRLIGGKLGASRRDG